jgi:hypothetical protein
MLGEQRMKALRDDGEGGVRIQQPEQRRSLGEIRGHKRADGELCHDVTDFA